MAAKGKWAQGIQPRHFHWIIQDQLAICERPGGFGANHRKVRRQEEIIWIREQGFDLVISVSPVAPQPAQLRRVGRVVAALAVPRTRTTRPRTWRTPTARCTASWGTARR